MARGALGALAGGLGQGMMMGQAAKDREADRALQERQIAALEQQAANPAPAFPEWAPPPSYTPGAGGTPPFNPTDGSGTPSLSYGAARGATPSSGYANSDNGPLLFSLTDKHEGGGRYDTLFGHSQKSNFKGTDVSRMTIGQLKEFSSPSGAYGQWVKGKVGRVATPMGRHQIVGTTLRATAKAMGLSDDTVFDGKTQDAMATFLAKRRLASASTMAGKRAALRAEWEGYKNVNDADLNRAIQQLET